MSNTNQINHNNSVQENLPKVARSRIVLASGSPRRLELMRNLGLEFEVITSNVDETIPPGTTPERLVQSLATEKAMNVLATLSQAQSDEDLVVIGADTMVVLDHVLIGKPEDEADARAMLRKLSQRTHIVFTGVTILEKRKDSELKTFEHVEKSLVSFRKLEETEIAAYVATREPMDKAGAYALQGVGAAFVEKVDGCYTNIIGLPIPKVVTLLRLAGVNILGLPNCQDEHLK